MKFKTESRERLVDRTIDGVTHQVRQRYVERVPQMPRDWDALAIKAAAGIVLALTGVAIAWSTTSIGALLGGGVGYAAAGVFDLSWLVVLLVEYLARFDAGKRSFAKGIGWALVLVAAGAIFLHGALQGDWALAGIGAAVSVVSKVLWLVVMRFIDREISDADAEWVHQEISGINAKEAIATVRLRAAVADERAALRLLQAEQIRHQLHTLRAPETAPAPALEQATEEPSQAAETPANSSEQAPVIEAEHGANIALNSADSVRDVREQVVPSIAELARQQVSAGAGVDEAVAAILALLPGSKAASVAATVRRERARQQRLQQATPGYL